MNKLKGNIKIFKNDKIIKNGFTLIELLIVVSIIGLLAGITITVINPNRQRNIAQESVNKQTMNKLAQGIEASYIATNSVQYPEQLFDNNTPLPLLQISQSDIPENLVYKTNYEKTEFCLCLPSLVKENNFLWFNSSSDKLQELTLTCESACE